MEPFGPKYEMLSWDMRADLCRIRALRRIELIDGTVVEPWELGGYVRYRMNLSQDGDCWVADGATA